MIAALKHLPAAAFALAALFAPDAHATITYREYQQRVVPKSPAHRRVAVAITVDRNAVERGTYETKLIQAMILAHFLDREGMEFFPRAYFNPDPTLMAELRAFEVDDLIELRLDKMKAPVVRGPERARATPRVYGLDGSLSLVNVCTGNAIVQTNLEKVPLPDIDAYADDLDGQTASMIALAGFMSGYYELNAQAVNLTPTCTADAAAAAAEAAGQFEEAGLILSEMIRRQPAREAELRDRRDLAILRSGHGGGMPAAGIATPVGSLPPPRSGQVDFLAPENRGKLFPISQGHVPVRGPLTSQAFAMSVGILAKDAGAKGGILIGSKTRSVYIGLAPAPPGAANAKLFIDTQNTVTGRVDARNFNIPAESFPLNRLVRLEIRYDAGDLTISIGGRPATSMPKLILEQPSLFLFGKLSTVYFQDVQIAQ